ncbi:MAG: acyl-CoA dehydrogenase [Alphaproteobacteria bacterium HGW-Alphaproteobacteria-8]|nr:MAG: acyl-CoA dehydrogenase [Alphaproteobacteria bacterium HGW-Alphaproteobacteria-8]
MPTYTPPLRDLRFVLHETLKIDARPEIEGYADLTPDITGAIFEEAGKVAADILMPLNGVGDRGCTLENGVVRAPEGFQAAIDALREGGWPSLECDPDYGGQGLPNVIALSVGEMQSAANMALMMYNGLTHGAYSAIRQHGTDAQKATYLPRLTSGEWTGTMNLTEPHCGTDLGLLRTRAEPQPDGSYKLTGQKIFISAGEHDLAENIIHLVIARIAGAPEGVKGISLFVCPKVLVNEDGTLGARNAVSCGKLEEKMGIHGNATCVMNYDGATAWLVGEQNKGLRAMFTMMNEARILVAMQGLAQASVAYQNASAYAKDRLQGRAVTGPANPDLAADPLIVHPDVRRLLLDQKAWIEGARAFMLFGSTLIDAEHRHADPAEREKAADMIALLIPVLKGVLTDTGFDCAVKAQQVLGGHGYIAEWGMEQFVRDARIAMIYEGANGVQALDLVGRKLTLKGGQPMMAYFAMIRAFIKENDGHAALKADFLDPLKAASKDLQAAAEFFMAEGMKNPDAALAGSNDFMHLFGHVAIAHAWAMMAKAAHDAVDAGTDEPDFYDNKLRTGRYYMSRLLPETALRLARIRSGAGVVMDLAADAF